jgi:hypothetical protein
MALRAFFPPVWIGIGSLTNLSFSKMIAGTAPESKNDIKSGTTSLRGNGRWTWVWGNEAFAKAAGLIFITDFTRIRQGKGQYYLRPTFGAGLNLQNCRVVGENP